MAVVALLSLLVAAWAGWIGYRALRISDEMQKTSTRQQDRADARDRLMWMHTVLNDLTPLQEAMAAPHETAYNDRQRWMRTGLAVGALRPLLPKTAALADRPFSDGWNGMVAAVEEVPARDLHGA